MGMFNSILSRLIGNKKQKEAAEMLTEMLLDWEKDKDGSRMMNHLAATPSYTSCISSIHRTNRSSSRQR